MGFRPMNEYMCIHVNMCICMNLYVHVFMCEHNACELVSYFVLN